MDYSAKLEAVDHAVSMIYDVIAESPRFNKIDAGIILLAIYRVAVISSASAGVSEKVFEMMIEEMRREFKMYRDMDDGAPLGETKH